MNPLTNVKNIKKLNETEIKLGITGKTSWHEEYKESAWIFIGGLPYDLTEGDILCVFSQYGEIVNINLIRDGKTGKSKGYAFLCYEDQRSTVLAVDNLNSIKLLGRVLRVDHVKDYKPPKEKDDEDEITKQLRLQGCAPKLVAKQTIKSEPDEKSKVKKVKKEKKKKHKKEKKQKTVSSSSSDSESGEFGTKHISKDSKRGRYNSPVRAKSDLHQRDEQTKDDNAKLFTKVRVSSSSEHVYRERTEHMQGGKYERHYHDYRDKHERKDKNAYNRSDDRSSSASQELSRTDKNKWDKEEYGKDRSYYRSNESTKQKRRN